MEYVCGGIFPHKCALEILSLFNIKNLFVEFPEFLLVRKILNLALLRNYGMERFSNKEYVQYMYFWALSSKIWKCNIQFKSHRFKILPGLWRVLNGARRDISEFYWLPISIHFSVFTRMLLKFYVISLTDLRFYEDTPEIF